MDRNFGSSEKGGFNEFSKTYKQNPTLENYVRMRRETPDAEIEFSVLGGIEPLFYMQSELSRYRLDSNLMAAVLDADPDAIDEISLQLMEKIIDSRTLSQSGETHLIRRGLSIPDKLIDWVICCALDALSWNNDLHIPRDLIVLIRERLGGSNPEYAQAVRVHEKKQNAAFIGGQLKARGLRPILQEARSNPRCCSQYRQTLV